MTIRPFALERYFAKYEFSVQHLLSSSDCDGWPLQSLLEWADDECKTMWSNMRLGYTESRGLPSLREEIATLYANDVGPDDVIVLAPQEGVYLAMRAMLQPGDHIVCTFPGYQSLYELALEIGCEVSYWKPREDAHWQFDIDDLKSLLRDDTKLIVANFPHNPTGAIPTHDEFAQVVAEARARSAYLFSDEMYRYLENEESTRLPSGAETYERAVSLFGMSKSFGLAGLRLGWLCTQDQELMERIATLKDYTTICSAGPSELLALIGLRSRERILTSLRQLISKNTVHLKGFLERQDQKMTATLPRGGTILFPRLRQGSATKLAEYAVAQQGVMVLPSSVYDYGDSHFRIGLGRADFPDALAAFERALDSFTET